MKKIVTVVYFCFMAKLCLSQVEVSVSAENRTDSCCNTNSAFYTKIDFFVDIYNNSDTVLFIPYNSDTSSREISTFDKKNLVDRIICLRSFSDSSACFERSPIIGLLPQSYLQEHAVGYLNLNFYGPVGIRGVIESPSFINSISFLTVKPFSHFNLSFCFFFETEGIPFSDFFVDKPLVVKFVFYKQGINFDKVSALANDSLVQPFLVEKVFQLDNFVSNSFVYGASVVDSARLEATKRFDENLVFFYIFGGW